MTLNDMYIPWRQYNIGGNPIRFDDTEISGRLSTRSLWDVMVDGCRHKEEGYLVKLYNEYSFLYDIRAKKPLLVRKVIERVMVDIRSNIVGVKFGSLLPYTNLIWASSSSEPFRKDRLSRSVYSEIYKPRLSGRK